MGNTCPLVDSTRLYPDRNPAKSEQKHVFGAMLKLPDYPGIFCRCQGMLYMYYRSVWHWGAVVWAIYTRRQVILGQGTRVPSGEAALVCGFESQKSMQNFTEQPFSCGQNNKGVVWYSSFKESNTNATRLPANRSSIPGYVRNIFDWFDVQGR